MHTTRFYYPADYSRVIIRAMTPSFLFAYGNKRVFIHNFFVLRELF